MGKKVPTNPEICCYLSAVKILLSLTVQFERFNLTLAISMVIIQIFTLVMNYTYYSNLSELFRQFNLN